ncbi:glutamine synthetase type III N terminal-domain-containing protein [Mycotypha africana]|uniref:glutamine synthetase type III N terminal-domain-containing protein n=1 Tax=Mycotypha africana TaxID=64632 RepID=UPI002300AC7B|nr:glutamine synthetase type III N terminal-domain-containing protein [Mycotypha africana]KAI8979147.1 glutamine synthetase type III N terminal-domain-containing protein [Mycotypha africana]
MVQQVRINTFVESLTMPARNVEFPQKNGQVQPVSEVFGQNVFTRKEMAKMLPKPVYKTFMETLKGKNTIDKVTADAIAHAAKVWSIERGATHFTHWFQPLNDSTAEKHDSFLTLKSSLDDGAAQVEAIDTFSGSQLLQSEPDASSFPSGGMRTTFEARGYTVWDTKSPMFIQEGPHGTSVLYIPSVFISYNGEALDEKSVLLRSCDALEKVALEVLNVIEPKDAENRTDFVYTTLGTEQEYFLIDRGLYTLRPDLKITGRTLLGGLPPRHQQLEDHYFGKIPSRVLAAISECELELAKLGVPIKTRHNEVAPAQFEVAPIFEEALIAVDHNLLTMDVLHRVAHRHKLKVLFHEKPFKGVNGSGKHCNWSISTDKGENLLDPSSTPETNYRFLIFLVATLKAVLDHGDLLRAGIASASNDHRLGAQEAPPGIISAFLGSQLTEVLDAIEQGRPVNYEVAGRELQHVRVKGTVLDLKVANLPAIARDLTDRNRTSPFAFTGNKFEFRAVGSKQSPSFPMTLLNSAVAKCLHEILADLKAAKGDKPVASEEDQLNVIRKYIKLTKNVRFEGDNYSEEWVQEASKRGLANITKSVDAFERILRKENADMLKDMGVFSEAELSSRYHILTEKYAKDVTIEAQTMITMVIQQVLPAAYDYRRNLAEAAHFMKDIGVEASPEIDLLNELTPIVAALKKDINDLKYFMVDLTKEDDLVRLARACCEQVVPRMETIRDLADKLERNVADNLWPLPKYTELFLNI